MEKSLPAIKGEKYFIKIIKILKEDEEKVYILGEGDLWELREGEEESFWKECKFSFRHCEYPKIILSGKISRGETPIAAEAMHERKEIICKDYETEEVPESFTMDKAIEDDPLLESEWYKKIEKSIRKLKSL